MCLTHDGANHGIETRAVAAAGEYADIHDIKAKTAPGVRLPPG
jgi:hypothetical protein